MAYPPVPPGPEPGASSADSTPPLRCPVTDASCLVVPMQVLVPCGHVMSAAVVERMVGECPVCATGFTPEQAVTLLGDEDCVRELRHALPTRRAAKKRKAS